MAASDHLSKTLFHGTSAELRVGDVVRPTSPVDPRHPDRDIVASATQKVGWANRYAMRSNSHKMSGRTGVGSTKPVEGPVQGSLLGHVYEVAPVDPSEKMYEDHMQVQSKKGFRVTRYSHSVPSRFD